MTKTQFTPGPLTAVGTKVLTGTRFRSPGHVSEVEAEKSPTIVAECRTEHDAFLFAAAPDLLEALQTLLYACRDGAVLPRDAAHKQARAALVKALGTADDEGPDIDAADYEQEENLRRHGC